MPAVAPVLRPEDAEAPDPALMVAAAVLVVDIQVGKVVEVVDTELAGKENWSGGSAWNAVSLRGSSHETMLFG